MPKWYPAEDVKRPKRSDKKAKAKPQKLKAGLVPGTILILLSGRFRGKRVIFLKSLASGTLLVTGPYKVNGVPIRRVSQSYVIVTSQKVDLKGVKIPDITDAYFARQGASKKSDEEAFFAQASKGAVVSDQRKADQKALDEQLVKTIKATPMLKAYLNAKFSLKSADRPHEMKF